LARSFSLMAARVAYLERQEQGALFLCKPALRTRD
jgi:hypothetical protein